MNKCSLKIFLIAMQVIKIFITLQFYKNEITGIKKGQ